MLKASSIGPAYLNPSLRTTGAACMGLNQEKFMYVQYNCINCALKCSGIKSDQSLYLRAILSKKLYSLYTTSCKTASSSLNTTQGVENSSLQMTWEIISFIKNKLVPNSGILSKVCSPLNLKKY